MQNPILQQLTRGTGFNNNIQQIKQMMNIVKSSQNPQAMLENLASNNPRLRDIMQTVKQSGGSAKTAFYQLAQQRGINPNDILNVLK